MQLLSRQLTRSHVSCDQKRHVHVTTWVFSVFCPILAWLQPMAAGNDLRILPLGDSITHGVASRGADGGYSYRYRLWQAFVDSGESIDLLGSQDQPFGGNLNYPVYQGQIFDSDHEGHYGWSSAEIRDQLPGWLDNYDADIALVHLGHNDWWKSISLGLSTYADTRQNLLDIIQILRGDNPEIAILLAQVVPSNPDQPPEGSSFPAAHIAMLNSMIPEIAATATTATSPVWIVDQFTGFDPLVMIYDGVHPNALGEQQMARTWFRGLVARGFLANRGGDFSGDGVWSTQDLDALTAEIVAGTHAPRFDLTGDGLVTPADGTSWLRLAGALNLNSGNPYRIGDANLDGFVDGTDFGWWNSAKFTSSSEWSRGNFNFDSVVDGSDFGLWNQNKFTSSDNLRSVPEIGYGLFFWMCCVIVGAMRPFCRKGSLGL